MTFFVRRKDVEVIEYLPAYIRDEIARRRHGTDIEEIRIRVGQQVELLPMNDRFGEKISVQKMEEIINFLTDYSIFAYEEQIKKGYFTLEGGNRIGVAGAVNEDGGMDITALNIRIARQFIDCSKQMLDYIKNAGLIYNTLIVSGPGIGKTTYLRDCVRNLSMEFKVGVVDERSEIGAAEFGVPQNDLGPRSDVMDNCSKSKGMMMLLRSMSPQIIAVDEIGERDDYYAIEQIMNSGVKFIGTVHAGDIDELRQKKYIWKMIEKRFVERVIFLSENENKVRLFTVYDSNGNCLCLS